MSRRRGLLPVLALAAALGGCRGCPSSRPPIHLNPNMDNQPKYLAQAESAFFADGATMRPPIEGTVARGDLVDPAWARGEVGGVPVAALPVVVDEALLGRGEERYDIYCGLCHGGRGDGKGMLWARAQVVSADLTSERIAAMPDGQIYAVVRDGFGLMPGYAAQVPVADRWAIVAWVRQLQSGAGAAAALPAGPPVAGAGGEAGMQDAMPEVDPLTEEAGSEAPSAAVDEAGDGEGET